MKPLSARAQEGLALLALTLVAAGVGLEGGVVPALGGLVFVAAAILGIAVLAREGAEPLGTRARVGLVLLALPVLWAAMPVPQAARALLAPGQARWVSLAAPEGVGDFQAWLDALTRLDVEAALGAPTAWAHDVLAGVTATASRPGALDPDGVPWAVAQLVGPFALYVVGQALGRRERSAQRFAAGMVLLGVAEAVFGIANRNGPSTGIGTKVYYLGSATGTLVNRGHFGAFLLLALGAAWGIAAAQFPLQSDEVRRHRQRRNRSSQPPDWWETAGERLPRLALLGLGGGVICVAAILSQARGPLLGFGVAAAGIGLYTRRVRDESWHLGIGLGVPAVAGVVAAVGFGVRGAFGRFVELWTDAGGVSLSSRLAAWKAGAGAVVDSPIFGAGPGGWRLAWSLHERGAHLYDFQHAHNEVVEVAVELGLVGGLAVVLLLATWVQACVVGMRTAPHDPRTSIGIGATVGVVGVLLHSLGDFPLHTPGVALATAAMAGLARGALTEPAANVRPWGRAMLLLGALVAAGFAARQDRSFEGTRAEHVGELPSWYWTHRHEPKDAPTARRDRDDALALAMRSPLDPWAQAAVARTEARLARASAKGVEVDAGGSVERHAWAVELATARAQRLRAADPRLELHLGTSLLLLATTGQAPDAWKARGATLLAHAVALDSWRAHDAFAAADLLSDDQLATLAAAKPEDPAARARIAYEYGLALAERKRPADALAAWDEALALNPDLAQAWFQAGVGRHLAGDEAAARPYFEGFLRAEQRPGGMEGWALLYLGELEAADAKLRKVVSDAPRNRWAWDGLAEVARRRSDPDAEANALRHIAELAPGDTAVRARLRDLELTRPAR